MSKKGIVPSVCVSVPQSIIIVDGIHKKEIKLEDHIIHPLEYLRICAMLHLARPFRPGEEII